MVISRHRRRKGIFPLLLFIFIFFKPLIMKRRYTFFLIYNFFKNLRVSLTSYWWSGVQMRAPAESEAQFFFSLCCVASLIWKGSQTSEFYLVGGGVCAKLTHGVGVGLLWSALLWAVAKGRWDMPVGNLVLLFQALRWPLLRFHYSLQKTHDDPGYEWEG